MRETQILNDNYEKVYYAVIIEGKTVFTGGTEISADHFRLTLDPNLQAKARVERVTIDGKQILFG